MRSTCGAALPRLAPPHELRTTLGVQVGMLHSALVRQLVLRSLSLPPALASCIAALHTGYTSVRDGTTLTSGDGASSSLVPGCVPIVQVRHIHLA
jgi:hypothetical protein